MCIERFSSAREFLDYIAEERQNAASARPPLTNDGEDLPPLLFRGETENHTTTLPSIARPLRVPRTGDLIDTELVRGISTKIAEEFARNHDVTLNQAFGFLQHYRLPTEILDFTSDPEIALSFAVESESSTEGHIAVMPTERRCNRANIEPYKNPLYAMERPVRQYAFGLTAKTRDGRLMDLKSKDAAKDLAIRWYRVKLQPNEARNFFQRKASLLAKGVDPFEGVLRIEITRFVCRHGKFDDRVAQLFASLVPKAPVFGIIRRFDGGDAIVEYGTCELPPNFFDEKYEEACSYLEWSCRYPGCKPSGTMHLKCEPLGDLVILHDSYHGGNQECYDAWQRSGCPHPSLDPQDFANAQGSVHLQSCCA